MPYAGVCDASIAGFVHHVLRNLRDIVFGAPATLKDPVLPFEGLVPVRGLGELLVTGSGQHTLAHRIGYIDGHRIAAARGVPAALGTVLDEGPKLDVLAVAVPAVEHEHRPSIGPRDRAHERIDGLEDRGRLPGSYSGHTRAFYPNKHRPSMKGNTVRRYPDCSPSGASLKAAGSFGNHPTFGGGQTRAELLESTQGEFHPVSPTADRARGASINRARAARGTRDDRQKF